MATLLKNFTLQTNMLTFFLLSFRRLHIGSMLWSFRNLHQVSLKVATNKSTTTSKKLDALKMILEQKKSAAFCSKKLVLRYLKTHYPEKKSNWCNP